MTVLTSEFGTRKFYDSWVERQFDNRLTMYVFEYFITITMGGVKVELPEKDWYTLQEVAKRWNRDVDYVLHLIQTGKLEASVYLSNVKCEVRTPPYDDFNDEIFTVAIKSGLMSPVFFHWDSLDEYMSTTSQWKGNLQNVPLVSGPPWSDLGDENPPDEVISPIDSTEIDINGLYISNQELESIENYSERLRAIFQGDYKIISSKQDAPCDEVIHPRTEKTLLTIIGALLKIISGEFCEDLPRHPGIKNQSELITMLNNSEIKGLSKPNLEKYFPLAKRILES